LITTVLIALLSTACGGAAPVITEAPAQPPDPTAPPAPTTVSPTEPPSGPRPLDAVECQALADSVSQAIGIAATVGQAPFEDYVTGESTTGCQVLVDSSDAILADVNTSLNNLTGALQANGWQEDMRYGGGGAGGYIAGYRKDDSLCLFVFSSEPADPSQCGDEPFVACWERLPPEERLRSFDFVCAQGVTSGEPAPPPPPPPTTPPEPTGLLPLDPAQCQALADLVSQATGIPATVGEVPFSDFRTQLTGNSCQVRSSGSEATVSDFGAATDGLIAALQAAGWQEDPRYGAAGAGGWVTGFRKGDALCSATFSSEPSDPSLCGDEPFAVCWERLTPEQRLRNFTLNCVHDPYASLPPTAVVLEDGTQCTYAGEGATLAFENLRLNYDCGLVGENQVGLLGTLFPNDETTWLAEKATIGHGDDGFYLIESELVTVYTTN
jgi:hypothetical protein